MPNGVFSPYTGIKTNILFFEKTDQEKDSTKIIWFYEHPYPKGYKNYSKTRPMQFDEFQLEREWWRDLYDTSSYEERIENKNAWRVDFLKEKLEVLEKAKPYYAKADEYEKKSKRKNEEVQNLNAKIRKLRKQIKDVNNREREIQSLDKEIESQKALIKSLNLEISGLERQTKEERSSGDRVKYSVYNLDRKNPNSLEEEIASPNKLIGQIDQLQVRILELQHSLRETLSFSADFSVLGATIDNIESLKEAILTLAVLGKLEQPLDSNAAQEVIKESINIKRQLTISKVLKRQKDLLPLEKDELEIDYPSQWSIAMFDDLASISGGVTKGRKIKDKAMASYPFLRVANVQRGYFILDDIHEIEIPVEEYERYSLQEGDILIAEGGDWDKVGRTAIWRGQLQNCLHQNHIFKARMFSDRIEKEWVELVFNSSIGKQYWANASKQTTNLASINMTQVRSFPIPVPSPKEQKRIISKLKKLLNLCNALLEVTAEMHEIQRQLSKFAIRLILNHEEDIYIVDESPHSSAGKNQLSVKIALASSSGEGLDGTTLAKILKKHNAEMEAKDLWKASGLKEIDNFYGALKNEIEAGFVQSPSIAELLFLEVSK